MTIPLMFLAVASIFAGFIPFHHLVTSDGMPFDTHIDYAIAIPSVLIALLGIGVATYMYKKENTAPERVAASLKHLYKWSFNKFYIDEVYLFVTKKIIFRYISVPVAWFDRHVVDGTMNGIAWATQYTSNLIKGAQSGQLQKHAFVFVTGAVLLLLIFIYLW
jgi:NADH-quinone oxidoreductase subunit L